jgi:hypothetical protein
MMSRRIPIHGYLVKHGPGSRVRVTVNGFPLYGGTTERMDSISGVLNHLMVPGANTLRAEVLHGDRDAPAGLLEVDARGSDTYPRARLSWLDDVGTVPSPSIIDWIGEASFESEAGLPAPMWLQAPSEPVPEEGTDELWAEIDALVRAFQTAAAEDVVSMFSLKASDMHDMMETKWSPPSKVREMMTSTLDRPWHVQPSPRETTVFRSFQNDRLVHVGRLDAGDVFKAARIGGERPVSVSTDLVFMRHDGRWRIIR